MFRGVLGGSFQVTSGGCQRGPREQRVSSGDGILWRIQGDRMSLSEFGVSQGLFVRIQGLIWGVQSGFGGSGGGGVQCPRGC